MNELQIFKNAEFGEVRTTVVNDEPMFCLADVCKALDISHVADVKSRLKEDGVATSEVIDRLGRKQIATFINESNLYKTIFQSKKPNAEKFTDWVTEEVIPSIRKHGAYLTDQKALDIVTNPQNLIGLLEQAAEQLKQKDIRIAEMRPKEIFTDAVTESRTSILVGDLAKLICQNGIEIGQKRLFTWMRENGYLIKRKGSDWNMPTQRAMDMELFEIKESVRTDGNGCTVITKTPKVTGKGQVYFINKFKEEQDAKG